MAEYFLDNFRHLYLRFDDRFVWPSVHLIHSRDSEILAVRKILQERFPGFDQNFAYWENDPFSGNQKYLVFVAAPQSLREQGMAFELRVLSAYVGGAVGEEIRKPAEQDRSPEFETDRIYFKAFLLPVDEFEKGDDGRVRRVVVRAYQEILEASQYTLSHEHKSIWATALFDSIDYGMIHERLQSRVAAIAPWGPGSLFPPIIIERMTFCLQVLGLEAGRQMASPFREFIEQIQDDNPDLLSKSDWVRYNQSMILERVLSRAGNPHWRFVREKVPG